MKSLSQYIKEEFKFRINKETAKVKYNYFVETKDELKQIIQDHYANNIYNLNDINTSRIEDFSELFLYDSNTGNPEFDVSEWDVSNGKTFEEMFAKCDNFNCDLSNWTVSKGENFKFMFSGCNNFNSDLSNWDVSNGIDFAVMFAGCNKFNSDLSNWDVSKGIYFNSMFRSCENFNSDLSKWDVSKGQTFSYMFDNCPIKQEFKPKHADIS